MPYVKDYNSEDLNDDDIIWRYIDFAKFVDILERRELYFVSGSKLAEIDPYEGHFQKERYANQNRLTKHDKELFKHLDTVKRKEHPKFVFINCWHVNNETDSDAMWKIYATKDRGIAIRTTVKKLKRSFHDYFQMVYIKKIKYVDNLKKDVQNFGIIDRFSVKGESYKHENELRVFVVGMDNRIRYNATKDGSYDPVVIPPNERVPIQRDGDDGIYVKVDLKFLMEKIIVSPISEKWFLDVVKAITKKYNLNPGIVEKSELYSTPSI